MEAENNKLNNVDQFSIYTAKIFEILYDSFPISCHIDQQEVIQKYLTFNKNEELKKLQISLDFIRTISDADNKNLEEMKAKLKEMQPSLDDQYTKLSQEKRKDEFRQEQIFKGTLDFLCYEGLIRDCDNGYQLTAKGFSHLNKSFKGGEITDEEDRNISILRRVFKSETSIQVVVGTIVDVLAKVFGYA